MFSVCYVERFVSPAATLLPWQPVYDNCKAFRGKHHYQELPQQFITMLPFEIKVPTEGYTLGYRRHVQGNV